MQRIGAVTAGVKGFIASQVAVVDGGNSPHLLHVPCGVDNLLKSSVQLAALLGQYLELIFSLSSEGHHCFCSVSRSYEWLL